jgi:predicted methyltransferase
VLAACLQLDPEASERLASGAASSSTVGSTDMLDSGSPSRIDAVMRNPARMAADREQDERRKAAEVLRFYGIKPGMVVLDLYSGI